MSELAESIRVLGVLRTVFCRTLYRPLMRLAHYYHWHYAPPLYIEKDKMLWCQWCGFRQVTKPFEPVVSLQVGQFIHAGETVYDSTPCDWDEGKIARAALHPEPTDEENHE